MYVRAHNSEPMRNPNPNPNPNLAGPLPGLCWGELLPSVRLTRSVLSDSALLPSLPLVPSSLVRLRRSTLHLLEEARLTHASCSF